MTRVGKIEPIHPGEVLIEDFIEGFGVTQNKLAVSIGVPPRRINEIVHGKRGISADTALRLARYFGTSAEFWINLQSHYELDRAEEHAGEQIASITPLSVAYRVMGEAIQSAAPDTSGFTLQVYVPTDQVASARQFYARLFGREPDFEPHDDFLEWAPIAGQECFFQVAGRSPALALGSRVRFRVRDLAAAVAFLDECGIAHSVPARLPDVVAFLNFADPWGNQLGYYEDLVPTEQQRTYSGTSVSDESQFEDHQV